MISKLKKIAVDSLKKSYSPYSKFKVGAALATKDGKIFSGCNIENASYSTTICAERCVVFKAVSEGYMDFETLVLTTDNESLSSPCGSCLQVLTEFCDANFKILIFNSTSKTELTLRDFLPRPFDPNDLNSY